ncbi:serine arginine-rich splicing factor [Cichlidogyrus casuarinus]|uniref:Serine arginine-rich splicing factor n=1 Tax=Cichlidogyrus casuarinus TaxID=1844966 RepID=A0ABD2QGV1_9PLAT
MINKFVILHQIRHVHFTNTPVMSRGREGECKVYVGDLPRDASQRELQKAFQAYGRLRSVWVAQNPPGFAFVEFENSNDALDSVDELNGTVICGSRVRVEISNGRSRPKPWARGARGSSGGGGGGGRGPPSRDERCYECGRSGHFAYECRQRRGSRDRSPRDRSRERDR